MEDEKDELRAHLGIQHWLVFEHVRMVLHEPFKRILARVDTATMTCEVLQDNGAWEQTYSGTLTEVLQDKYGRD